MVEIEQLEGGAMVRPITLSLLSLAATLIAYDAYSKPYKGKYVSELNTEVKYDGFHRVGPHDIELTISYEVTSSGVEKRKYPVKYIKDNFALSHDELLSLLRKRGYSPTDCKKVYSLHIFILSYDTMFFSDIFDKYEGERIPNTSIYGMLDATPEVWGNTNIILAPYSNRVDFKTMHHEFAHYWHNRYCLSDIYPDSEEFAEKMEIIMDGKYND